MSQIKNFHKANEFEFGRKYQSATPYYYASLHDGFEHYFNSVRNIKNTVHLSLDSLHLPDNLSLETIKMMDGIGLSILAFHRFFELFIKDLLARINPFLSVIVIDKRDEFFRFLDGSLSPAEVKTVEYGIAFQRLEGAFKYYCEVGPQYREIDRFRFLIEGANKEALGILTEWRNRIMHNGKTLPNCVSFDFLISQQIIPIVSKIIEAEQDNLKKWKPHFFESLSGVNIIEEICLIKFNPSEFNEPSASLALQLKYLRLAHLKELGRASFTQDYAIRNNVDYWESSYADPIGRAERFAESESSNDEFFKRTRCNCCNNQSMVVYKKPTDDLFEIGRNFHSWFKCFLCGYSLNLHMGDPFDFGLAEERVFPEV